MAANKIPEEIKKHRPGPCTEIKFINGHYYVYMYQAVQLPSGKWGKKTGKTIGRIVADEGFIPNKNYYLYEGTQSLDEITVLEYGQYASLESGARYSGFFGTTLSGGSCLPYLCICEHSLCQWVCSSGSNSSVTMSKAGFRKNIKPSPFKWGKLLSALSWMTLEEKLRGL